MWLTTLSFLTLAVSAFSYTIDSNALQKFLREFESKQVRDSVQDDTFKKACGGMPADIVFIIDDSRSIYPPRFEDQINFLAKFVRIFTISPKAVRVGAVTYGERVIKQNTFHWDDNKDEESLVNAISGIKFDADQGGSTETGLALKYAYDHMFSNGRKNVQKIAILITDGVSTHPHEASAQAEVLRNAGVTIIAIGVGDQVSRSELVQLAGNPDHVFLVAGYNLLDKIKQKLQLKTCLPPTTTPAPTTPQMEQPCEKDIDVNFVFDSGMMGDRGMQDVVNFIESSISDRDLSRNNIKFGAVAGPCNKVYGFALNQYRTKSEIMRHFDQYHQTALAPLLQETGKESFSYEKGGRPGARKVAVIFLKGKLNDPSGVAARADALRADGIEVFVVSMDNMNSQHILEGITPSGNILYADSRTNMLQLSGEFSNRLCKLPGI